MPGTGWGHTKTVCKDCTTLISQCKCPSPVKQVVYGLCPKCTRKRAKERK